MLQLGLFLLLPLAAFFGWLAGYHYRKSIDTENDTAAIPHDYFLGLNYLINEQPDKAVDVFIKMLEVNTDTVETHLALGNLFRRRGEVDRAIRIHQNLTARPQLAPKQRLQALFELAQDYLRAGVLDRAEKLFLELIDLSGDINVSLNNLINIYQQQKDWQQAISTAKKLEKLTKVDMNSAVAHYYCELADQAHLNNHDDEAVSYLKEALHQDQHCARANIILGELFFVQGKYQQAIQTLQLVDNQDREYVSEVITLLADSYKKVGLMGEFSDYLTKNIAEKPRIYYILAMTSYLREQQGDLAAIDYLVQEMPRCLSLRGLSQLLELYINNHIDPKMKNQFLLLKEFTDKLLEHKPVYRCVHCGFASKKLYWQCPSCKRWNSIKPIHGLEGD